MLSGDDVHVYLLMSLNSVIVLKDTKIQYISSDLVRLPL